ncbi:MAG: hypothetical protein K9L32_00350 [Chromatiaceae bacterium]|nr:hypothetical protein [Chromatiaceae bacterium]MCF8002655.1 hypothetical protein [Chromatiaceae bacterium]
MEIDYEDFKRLCRVRDGEEGDTDGAEWAPWIRINTVGVYLKLPSDRYIESFPELLMAMDLPEDINEDAKHGKAPILSFPASVRAFQQFLEDFGLYGCVDPFDFVEWQAEKNQRALRDVSSGYSQEQAILAELQKQGHEPKLLIRKSGKADVKSEVRMALLKSPSIFTPDSFKHAWDRLRQKGEIQDAKDLVPK